MSCICDCHKGSSVFCSSCPDDGHTQQEYDEYFTKYAKKNYNMTLNEFKEFLKPSHPIQSQPKVSEEN